MHIVNVLMMTMMKMNNTQNLIDITEKY